jgi:hypothetical protein
MRMHHLAEPSRQSLGRTKEEYLGATSAWFGWVCGKGGPTRSNMQRLEKPPQ